MSRQVKPQSATSPYVDCHPPPYAASTVRSRSEYEIRSTAVRLPTMNRVRRLTCVLNTVFVLMVLLALPALGQDGPAVPVEPPEEPATVLDWTYRYLIPTALVIAVLVVIMTSIRYFTNVVRRRYRVVEE